MHLLKFVCLSVCTLYVSHKAAVLALKDCVSMCVCVYVLLHAVITKHKQQRASLLLPLAVRKTECVFGLNGDAPSPLIIHHTGKRSVERENLSEQH